jgi:hypothetical protein
MKPKSGNITRTHDTTEYPLLQRKFKNHVHNKTKIRLTIVAIKLKLVTTLMTKLIKLNQKYTLAGVHKLCREKPAAIFFSLSLGGGGQLGVLIWHSNKKKRGGNLKEYFSVRIFFYISTISIHLKILLLDRLL